jgi:hypothetical protein
MSNSSDGEILVLKLLQVCCMISAWVSISIGFCTGFCMRVQFPRDFLRRSIKHMHGNSYESIIRASDLQIVMGYHERAARTVIIDVTIELGAVPHISVICNILTIGSEQF